MDRLVAMSRWRIGAGILGILAIAAGLALHPGAGRRAPAPTDEAPLPPQLAASAAAAGEAEARTDAPEEAAHTIVSSLIKVRPDRPLPSGAATIELRVLRGECELRQIALRAGAAPLPRIQPQLEGDLGEGVEMQLYRQAIVSLARPSGPEGEAGRWPDPLIPARDPHGGEARRAFPFGVPAGESRAVLLEVCVTSSARPGDRAARIRLLGMPETPRIPLRLRIEAASIPATSSLPTSFGFSALRAALGHHGRAGTPAEVEALSTLYRRELLAHRISAHGGTMEPPPFRRDDAGELELDFRAYDQELGPFLEGKALPSGAKATTAELRTHPALEGDGERIRYWAAIAMHHRERGWEAILFDYAQDEPERGDLPSIAARARLVKRADPTIRILVTASLEPSLVEVVDLWTPNLNCLWIKERPDEFCSWRAPPSAYRALGREGVALWWYQSCSSHGCDDEEVEANDYFRGWPSYVIDAPGTRARIMGWLAWSEEIEGELYWDTVHGYAPEGPAGDPWEGASLRAFGGNGDGTLLYPGTPARIGGETHVPIPSLRLKQIRDGLEDYELLRLVAARPGGRELARREATALAPSPFQVRDDAAAMEAARGRLLDHLAIPQD